MALWEGALFVFGAPGGYSAVFSPDPHTDKQADHLWRVLGSVPSLPRSLCPPLSLSFLLCNDVSRFMWVEEGIAYAMIAEGNFGVNYFNGVLVACMKISNFSGTFKMISFSLKFQGCIYYTSKQWSFLVAQLVENLPAMQETRV